jgi:transposase
VPEDHDTDQIATVLMESTGVYWIPVDEMLEAQGFQVHLVQARHMKYVPGRKTDVQDCQWIQYLQICVLFSGSCRPEA